MENNIPTAEEQIKEFKNGFDGLAFQNEAEISITKFLMIEFAKLHVEAALESAAENTKEWRFRALCPLAI